MSRSEQSLEVVIGVDTHKEEHVAVALDQVGGYLALCRVNSDAAGYGALEQWASGLGHIRAFGIEGTGSYGAGLSRFLTAHGYAVLEVSRTKRVRQRGKSDPADAEAAARAVLAGTVLGVPKQQDGPVEMLRLLQMAKQSALKARTQAVNQLRALLVTAPDTLRQSLRGLSLQALLKHCAALRPGPLRSVLAALKQVLRLLARRIQQLGLELAGLNTELATLSARAAPGLTAAFGIGGDSAAALLVTAGSNPERVHSEAAFAALCGVNPIPASSGKTQRHRLNRGGDRRANAALHRVVIVRLRHDPRTHAYVQRRTAQGLTKNEIIRCLKRYVAREVFGLLPGRQPCRTPS